MNKPGEKSIWRHRGTVNFVLIDVVIGGLVTLLFWLASRKAMDSLLLGLGATAYLWILWMRVQISLSAHDTKDQIETLQVNLESAAKLKLEALGDEEMIASVRSVLAGASHCVGGMDDSLADYCRSRIVQFGTEMERAAEGEISVPSDVAWRFALRFIGESKSIFATTFSSRRAFWSTAAGREYRIANEKAVKNGATITRVFILDGGGDNDEFLLHDVVKSHVESGMNVWLVDGAEVDESKTIDIAVFDGRVVSIWASPRPEEQISKVIWSTARRRIALFRELESYFSFRALKISNAADLAAWEGKKVARADGRI